MYSKLYLQHDQSIKELVYIQYMLYVMQYLQLMQQYTNQAYNYAGYYINAVKQWWYPPEQIPQGPIEQLKFYLQNSNVEFKTKHSEQKIIIQRICMMYSQVLTGDDKKYQNFKPTIQKPLQFYQEQSTKNTLEHKQQEQQAIKKQKCLVSIQGELKIRSEKIKCSLLVTIVILPQIEDKLPLIFIRNPDAYKTQPNLLYTQAPHDIYESILGGVTLSQLELKKLQNQWKQYKAHNLLNLIKKINMLLIEYFPFVKRYSPFQTLATNSQEYKKVESLKNQFNNYLPKVQSLAILKECIQSENKHLSEQNRSLKKILENQKIGDSESFFKIFTVTQNRQLFELLSIERAYLDCIRLVQNQQLNQMYANSTQYMKTLAAKHFEAKFKIKQFIERIQANMSTFL